MVHDRERVLLDDLDLGAIGGDNLDLVVEADVDDNRQVIRGLGLDVDVHSESRVMLRLIVHASDSMTRSTSPLG